MKTPDPEEQPSTKPNSTDAREEEEAKEGPNLSNSIKVYAKLENNYHLSNKYALFYNMRKYYKALDRDPFEVLPLTFHIKSGTSDPEYKNFLAMHKQYDQ